MWQTMHAPNFPLAPGPGQCSESKLLVLLFLETKGLQRDKHPISFDLLCARHYCRHLNMSKK